jgi:hypothetical protein
MVGALLRSGGDPQHVDFDGVNDAIAAMAGAGAGVAAPTAAKAGAWVEAGPTHENLKRVPLCSGV